MVLTTELAGLLFTIFCALVGGGWALWRKNQSEIDKVRADVQKELDKIETKVDGVAASAISRAEYQSSIDKTERIMDSFGLAIRELSANMTQRIDMVLFELGRQNSGKKD